MEEFMKYLLILLALVAPVSNSQELYIVTGVEHISSIFNGKPFNSKHETSVDMLYTGIRYEKKDWSIEADVIHALQPEEFEGSNPRAIFRIEKKFRIK